MYKGQLLDIELKLNCAGPDNGIIIHNVSAQQNESGRSSPETNNDPFQPSKDNKTYMTSHCHVDVGISNHKTSGALLRR